MDRDPDKSKPGAETATRPETFFAPPGRRSDRDVHRTVAFLQDNPVVDLLLETSGSILAVLNDTRQVVAVNHVLLEALGLDEPEQVLGLRPGEALDCVHAQGAPNGCGTGRACRTCGAVLAILASQQSDASRQGECHITARRHGREVWLSFQARATPVHVEDQVFTVLFLQDISDRKRRQAMERTFFHDSLNTIAALHNLSHLQMLPEASDKIAAAENILRLTHQLRSEIEWHRDLELMLRDEYEPNYQTVRVGQVLADLEARFSGHHLRRDRDLQIDPPGQDLPLRTSRVLLDRVLGNMVINALEAGQAGQTVRVWTRRRPGRIDFKVHNAQHIPPEVALRIFEGQYTTKPGPGRGLGTYSMKLLAENYLDATVGFVTCPTRGTIFRLRVRCGGQDGLASGRAGR